MMAGGLRGASPPGCTTIVHTVCSRDGPVC